MIKLFDIQYRRIRIVLYLFILIYFIFGKILEPWNAHPYQFIPIFSVFKIKLTPVRDTQELHIHSVFRINQTSKSVNVLRFVVIKPCSVIEPTKILVTIDSRRVSLSATYWKLGEFCPFIVRQCNWVPYYVDVPLQHLPHQLLPQINRHYHIIDIEPSRKFKLVQCTKTMLGLCNWMSLVRFVEWSMRISKIQYVYTYQTMYSRAVHHISQLYMNEGFMHLIPWPVLHRSSHKHDDMMKHLLFHGQLLNAQDCLLRAQATGEFSTFVDYDEFVVLDRAVNEYFDANSGAILIIRQQTDALDVHSVLSLHNDIKIADLTNDSINFDTDPKFIVRLGAVHRVLVHKIFTFTHSKYETKNLPIDQGRILHVRFTSQSSNHSLSSALLTDLVQSPHRLQLIKQLIKEGKLDESHKYVKSCSNVGRFYDEILHENLPVCPSLSLSNLEWMQKQPHLRWTLEKDT